MNLIAILLAVLGAAAAAQQQAPDPVAQQRAAIARQRASIRQQAARLSAWMLPAMEDPPPVSPVCAPLGDAATAPLIESAAKTQNIEPPLIRAVIEQESAFRPCAVSPRGAQGLMQLMPETARELQVADPFDPEQNIQAGAKYLKQLIDKYKGDLAQALAAYNAGPNTVDQSGGVPGIPETQGYVEAILEKIGKR